jgi:autotransporter-associated beta strand protein
VNISSLNTGTNNVIITLAGFFAPFTGKIGLDTSHVLFFPDLGALNGSAIAFAVTGTNPGIANNVSFVFSQTSNSTIQLGELTGNGVIASNSTASTTNTWQVGALNTSTTFSGIFRNNVIFGTGIAAVTKVGTGTFTLSGANTYTGGTTVGNGILNVTGTLAAAPSGNLVVGNAANNAVLNVSATGTATGQQLSVGTVGGAAGAVNLVPGSTLTMVSVDGGGNNDAVHSYGVVNGGYGALNMSGGTLTEGRFQFGGVTSVADTGIGVGVISGGTVYSAGYMIVGRTGSSTASLTITGGTINHANATQNLIIGLGGTGSGGHAEFNVAGGVVDNTGQALAFSLSGFGFNGNRSILNLDAGILQTNSITYSTGTASMNFNGGTLKATASGTFIPSANPVVYVNGPFGTFSGGAVIDTNANANTIAANLLTPPGSGVSAAAVSAAGSGYIGAPYVLIAGTGTGATAIANMVSDGGANGTLKVGSVTITNPGVSYTGTPTYTFSGGGAATAATPGTVTIAVNTSGGLTKNGVGVLTLNGANTYTGPTQVNAGGLGGIGTLASSVTMGSMVTLNPGDSATPGRLTLANATPIVLNTNTQIIFRLNSVAAASDAALTNTAVASNDSIDTTAGAVNMNGATINVTGTLAPGFYRLIVGSSFTGTPFNVVAAAGSKATLIQNTASIDVQITASATYTWSGGGADANWMTTGNWTPSVPLGNANEALIFPSGAAQQTNVNNFPNGTSFGSIVYNGAAATAYITTALDAAHGSVALTGAGTTLQSAVAVEHAQPWAGGEYAGERRRRADPCRGGHTDDQQRNLRRGRSAAHRHRHRHADGHEHVRGRADARVGHAERQQHNRFWRHRRNVANKQRHAEQQHHRGACERQ